LSVTLNSHSSQSVSEMSVLEEIQKRDAGQKVTIIQEVWRDCYLNEQKYEVSNLGMVRNKKSGKYLAPMLQTKKGYQSYVVKLKGEKRKVHQLVWRSFMGGREVYPYVIDHINGISLDNRLINLQLLTNTVNGIKGNNDWSNGLF